MGKKAYALVLALFTLLGLLGGCSQGGANSAAPAGEGAGGKVKVGWVGSLSGDQAVWGQCESEAVKMYFEKLNAEGGLLGNQVEVVAYDTRGDATETVNAVKRLTGQDKVIAIIGPNTSGAAIAMSSVLDEVHVPAIITVATNPKVTVNDDGSVKPYMFRVCFIDPYQGAVGAGFSYDVLEAKKAAILYDVGDDYSQGISEYFEKTFVEKGGEVVAKEAFKTGDVDFRPQLTKIKTGAPDVIFMPFSYKEVALATAQARELGIDSTFIGTDTWPSEQLFNMAKEAVQGSYIVNHLDFADPTVKEVQDMYKERTGKDSEINGYLAWDACTMLTEGVNAADSLNPEQIAKALEDTDFAGVTGNIIIGKDTHNPEGKEAAIIKIEGDSYIFVQRYSPEK